MRHFEILCPVFRERPVLFKYLNPSNCKNARNTVLKEAVITNVACLGSDVQVSRLLQLKQMTLRYEDVVDHSGFQEVYFSYLNRLFKWF